MGYKDVVNDMIGEITGRLLGKKASIPSGDGQVQVWADAASFLGSRVQTCDSPDNDVPHENRRTDMSKAASEALKAMLGQLEAAHRLMANRETVVRDIINPGPDAVLGGKITQTELKRVDSKYKASLDEMIKAVCSHLLGQELSLPSKPEEALAWAQAATYLYGRIQAYAREMPDRAPDMSPHAAKAMRTSLAQIEASSKLMSNRETVVKDITNVGSGPQIESGRNGRRGVRSSNGQEAVWAADVGRCDGVGKGGHILFPTHPGVSEREAGPRS